METIKKLIPNLKIFCFFFLGSGCFAVEQSNNPVEAIIEDSPLENKEKAPLIWGTRSTDTYEEIKKQMEENSKTYNLSLKKIKIMLLMGHGTGHKEKNNYQKLSPEDQEQQASNFAIIYLPMFTPKIYLLSQKIEEKWIMLEEELSSSQGEESTLDEGSMVLKDPLNKPMEIEKPIKEEGWDPEVSESKPLDEGSVQFKDPSNKAMDIKNRLTAEGWEPELCAKSIYAIISTIKKIYHGLNSETTIDEILATIDPFSHGIIDWEIQ